MWTSGKGTQLTMQFSSSAAGSGETQSNRACGCRFYAALFSYRIGRLRQKYSDLREVSGSPRLSRRFVLTFIRRRFTHFLRHLLARWRTRRAARTNAIARAANQMPHLAIKITGGVGDCVMAARYLRDLTERVEPISFDLYCSDPGAAEWIFASNPGFNAAYTVFLFDELKANYDLALWVTQFIAVYVECGNLQKIQENRRLSGVIQNIIRARSRIEPFIREHPKWDNFFGRRAVFANLNRMTVLHGQSNMKYGGEELYLITDKSIMKTLGLTAGQFLTVHNGFDLNSVVLGKFSTKCYRYFDKIVRQIKLRCPDLPIVQLGTQTSTAILGVDYNLIGKTTLPQAACLLGHAAHHIDNESGLVHIARCLGTQSTVMFGPTPVDYFGYEANQNIAPATCGGCWWINETWMSHCPRGFATPICMSQDPQVIARMVLNVLLQRDRIHLTVGSSAAKVGGLGGLRSSVNQRRCKGAAERRGKGST